VLHFYAEKTIATPGLYRNAFALMNASWNGNKASYKNLTDTLKAFQTATGKLSGALTCANFPPSREVLDPRYNMSRLISYLPETYMWVDGYRQGTFMLPHTEDFLFQIDVGSQQMYDVVIDLERAGIRPPHKYKPGNAGLARSKALRKLPETAIVPGRPMMQYVLAFDPGNTVNSHRRRLYSGFAHGNKWTDLYVLETFATGPGDFCDGENGMYEHLYTVVNEIGMFDDILVRLI
jgi:hypothetical protein